MNLTTAAAFMINPELVEIEPWQRTNSVSRILIKIAEASSGGEQSQIAAFKFGASRLACMVLDVFWVKVGNLPNMWVTKRPQAEGMADSSLRARFIRHWYVCPSIAHQWATFPFRFQQPCLSPKRSSRDHSWHGFCSIHPSMFFIVYPNSDPDPIFATIGWLRCCLHRPQCWHAGRFRISGQTHHSFVESPSLSTVCSIIWYPSISIPLRLLVH